MSDAVLLEADTSVHVNRNHQSRMPRKESCFNALLLSEQIVDPE